MARDVVSSGDPIPLTLPLSQWEREQSAAGSIIREVRRVESALGCAEKRQRISPLPEGEGRGEGKRDMIFPTDYFNPNPSVSLQYLMLRSIWSFWYS